MYIVLFLLFLSLNVAAMDYQLEESEILECLEQNDVTGKELFYRLLKFPPEQIATFFATKQKALHHEPIVSHLYNFLKYQKLLSIKCYRNAPSLHAYCLMNNPEIVFDPLFSQKIMAIEDLLELKPIVLPPLDYGEPLPEGFYKTDHGYMVEIYYTYETIIGLPTEYGTVIAVN